MRTLHALVAALDAAVLPGAVQQARRAQQRHQQPADTAPARCAAPCPAGCRGTAPSTIANNPSDAGLEDVPQVRDAGEAPQAAIQADLPEHQALGGQDQRDLGRPQGNFRRIGDDAQAQAMQALPDQPDHAGHATTTARRGSKLFHRSSQELIPCLPHRRSLRLLAKDIGVLQPRPQRRHAIANQASVKFPLASSCSDASHNAKSQLATVQPAYANVTTV